ncbi:glutathione-regulated potassium-efflux system ancillary protein KefF (plasmid) [Pseudosulfitobacter pseudonitzschiae]|uniref:Glutathione-regulated potassium-efflux system ancillary protein KefF n=2 Tax=Rhodobacterales TaxID=204455 RepID=A0A221K649_9RHOB|nr:NAD(P)H-dependent oxidoreductase [Pseudosulfitobacter pseudonitzschiae]ASM74360.1 glutathione-regulated potassium-efflux system ancillary protein KefF [Pseudosulfitobacter pseudonitzschiae]
MHTHIVHVHPETASYNGALTRTAEHALRTAGGMVTVTDLYRAGFDPVERFGHYANRVEADRFAALGEQRNAWATDTLPGDVVDEIDNLERADLVILQFPLWWHGPPAMLKGWMDRVFISGGLYTRKMRYDAGYFRGRRALISVTTGAPRAAFGQGSRGGDFDTLLWPVQYSMHYMGFSVLRPFVSYGVQGHGYSYEGEGRLRDRLSRNLDDWSSCLLSLDEVEPLSVPSWADWNEDGSAIASRQN